MDHPGHLRPKKRPRRRPAQLVLTLCLAAALPALSSCTVAEPEAPVVGSWRAEGAGSIEFLEGGGLGEVSLVPGACRGENSSTEVKFTGTWRHGAVEDAGYGALVKLASVDGTLACETYFQYVKHNGEETLSLNDLGTAGTGFHRTGAGHPTASLTPVTVRTDVEPLQSRFPELGALSQARWIGRTLGTPDPRPAVPGPTDVTVDGYAKVDPAKLAEITANGTWKEEHISCPVPAELAAELGTPRSCVHSELFDRSITWDHYTGSFYFDRENSRVYFCTVNPKVRVP